MWNQDLLLKILRYLLQFTIIYLVLRYTPYIQLDTMTALMITIIFVALTLLIEYVYVKLYSKSGSVEKFEDNAAECSTCNKPPETNNNQTCRLVCDGGVEHFDGEEKKNPLQTPIPPKVDLPPKIDNKPKVDTPPKVDNKPKEPQEKVVDQNNDDRYYWGTRYGNLGYDTRYGFGGMFYDEYPYYNRYTTNDAKVSRNTGDYLGDPEIDRQREKREQEYVMERREAIEEQARSTKGYDSPYQEPGAKSQRRKPIEVNRRIEGDLDDELPYGDYNSLPIAAGYKSHEYEYGYSFLPPEKWTNLWVRPPVCVTERRSPIMPLYSGNTTMDLKEFHSARRITPPDMINTDYVAEKLNAGR